MQLPCINNAFGGRAIELAGRVVEPIIQGKGLGTIMLKAFLISYSSEYLVTYTRNPGVLGMLSHVCGSENVFPKSNNQDLKQIATTMPMATIENGTIIHKARYGKGLYAPRIDPVYRKDADGSVLVEEFTALSDPGNALVVVAKVPIQYRGENT